MFIVLYCSNNCEWKGMKSANHRWFTDPLVTHGCHGFSRSWDPLRLGTLGKDSRACRRSEPVGLAAVVSMLLLAIVDAIFFWLWEPLGLVLMFWCRVLTDSWWLLWFVAVHGVVDVGDVVVAVVPVPFSLLFASHRSPRCGSNYTAGRSTFAGLLWSCHERGAVAAEHQRFEDFSERTTPTQKEAAIFSSSIFAKPLAKSKKSTTSSTI